MAIFYKMKRMISRKKRKKRNVVKTAYRVGMTRKIGKKLWQGGENMDVRHAIYNALEIVYFCKRYST